MSFVVELGRSHGANSRHPRSSDTTLRISKCRGSVSVRRLPTADLKCREWPMSLVRRSTKCHRTRTLAADQLALTVQIKDFLLVFAYAANR
jgi:hypothetical protein